MPFSKITTLAAPNALLMTISFGAFWALMLVHLQSSFLFQICHCSPFNFYIVDFKVCCRVLALPDFHIFAKIEHLGNAFSRLWSYAYSYIFLSCKAFFDKISEVVKNTAGTGPIYFNRQKNGCDNSRKGFSCLVKICGAKPHKTEF